MANNNGHIIHTTPPQWIENPPALGPPMWLFFLINAKFLLSKKHLKKRWYKRFLYHHLAFKGIYFKGPSWYLSNIYFIFFQGQFLLLQTVKTLKSFSSFTESNKEIEISEIYLFFLRKFPSLYNELDTAN